MNDITKIRKMLDGEEVPDMVDLVCDTIPALCNEIEELRTKLSEAKSGVERLKIAWRSVDKDYTDELQRRVKMERLADMFVEQMTCAAPKG